MGAFIKFARATPGLILTAMGQLHMLLEQEGVLAVYGKHLAAPIGSRPGTQPSTAEHYSH